MSRAISGQAAVSAPQPRAPLWALGLGSIGVAYGDIGTSPLYALNESLTAASAGGQLTEEMAIGVVSLTLWALTIVVTLKYVAATLGWRFARSRDDNLATGNAHSLGGDKARRHRSC